MSQLFTKTGRDFFLFTGFSTFTGVEGPRQLPPVWQKERESSSFQKAFLNFRLFFNISCAFVSL
jgi:hypothetical protein